MTEAQSILTIGQVLRLTGSTLRATARPLLWISGLGIFLPQFLADLFFDLKSRQVVADLRRLVDTPGSINSLQDFLNLSSGPVVEFFSCNFIMFLVFLTSYMLLSLTAARHLRSSQPEDEHGPVLASLIRRAFGYTVQILLVFIFVSPLLLVSQVLVLPAIILGVLAMMMPQIAVFEDRGMLRSLWHAVSLRYARSSRFTVWNISTLLLAFGTTVYAIGVGTSFLSVWVLTLQTSESWYRTLRLMELPGTNLEAFYLVVLAGRSLIFTALAAVAPAFLSSLYYSVRSTSRVSALV